MTRYNLQSENSRWPLALLTRQPGSLRFSANSPSRPTARAQSTALKPVSNKPSGTDRQEATIFQATQPSALLSSAGATAIRPAACVEESRGKKRGVIEQPPLVLEESSMNKCPYCDRIITSPSTTRTVVRSTPILLLACPYCRKLVGIVNANE